MNVKIPEPIFDIGSFELPDNEITLFGGFNADGATNKVYTFKITNVPEGEIKSESTTDNTKAQLQDKDFFVVNGITIKACGNYNECKDEIWVTGHQHVHAFDKKLKSFRTIKQE